MILERHDIADAANGITKGPLKTFWDQVVAAGEVFADVDAVLENPDVTVKLAMLYNSLCDDAESPVESNDFSPEVRENRRKVIVSMQRQPAVDGDEQMRGFAANIFMDRVQALASRHIGREAVRMVQGQQPTVGLE